jgi:hypothetical protein
MKKTGRNDPCPCGSGKKFKKCCESTMLGGRYKASKVEESSDQKVVSASRLTGLFKAQVAQISKPTEECKPIRATVKEPVKMAQEPAEEQGSNLDTPSSSEEGVEQKDDI